MVFIMLPWMQQIEFHPALFALMLLHRLPWSEEINVLGRISFLVRSKTKMTNEMNLLFHVECVYNYEGSIVEGYKIDK